MDIEENPGSGKNGIGTLQENSLHAGLKEWYAQPGDQFEVKVDGYIVDIVRGSLLIEIQTRNFSAMRRKLTKLIQTHPVRLVYPIALEKWIIKDGSGPSKKVSRRKSPRRGRLEHLFIELVRLTGLVEHPNLTLEVLLVREEELQTYDGQGSWRRRGWSIRDRSLIEVVEKWVFAGPEDYRRLLPGSLPGLFTTRELAHNLNQPLYISQKMAYCLRKMGVLHTAGKRGRSILYTCEDVE